MHTVYANMYENYNNKDCTVCMFSGYFSVTTYMCRNGSILAGNLSSWNALQLLPDAGLCVISCTVNR